MSARDRIRSTPDAAGGAPRVRARGRDLRRGRGAAARGRRADGASGSTSSGSRRARSSTPAAGPATRCRSSPRAIRRRAASRSTSRCRCSTSPARARARGSSALGRLLAPLRGTRRCGARLRLRRHRGAAVRGRRVRSRLEQPARCNGSTTCRARFAECHRVLAVGGLVTFTTFGPDTLKELRAAFAGVDRASARQPLRRHARHRRPAGAGRLRRSGDGDGIPDADLRRRRSR